MVSECNTHWEGSIILSKHNDINQNSNNNGFSNASGVAMGNFEATGPTMVPVRQGDMIEVLETHHTGWSYAKNHSHSFLVICC